MTTRRIPFIIGAAMACSHAWAVATPSLMAQPDESGRQVMLGRDLRSSLVSIAAIGDTSVRLTGEDGAAREIPLDDVVALAPGWWRPGTEQSDLGARADAFGVRRNVSAGQGMILLTDGRRLVGKLGAETEGDVVVWDHLRLGRSFFSLDDIRRIQFVSPGAAAPREGDDRVIMINGDAVVGFVESIGGVVKIESEGRAIELSMKQIASIELANPVKPASGPRVWLTDGSVAGAAGFAPAAGSGEFRLVVPTPMDGAAQVGLSPAEVMAIVPDAACVVPLASLPIESERGVGERLYAEPVSLRWRGRLLAATWRETAAPGEKPPPLDAPDIELPGPMSVEWTLPPGAARLAGWAEVPAESRTWAEFTLVFEGVSADGAAILLASESMSGSRPIVEFNFEIPRPAPARLRVRMEPGARGPIQDRAVLRRALLLVDPGAR